MVADDIDLGRKAIAALDKTEWRPKAAFWLYSAEATDWRLMLALPSLKRQGINAVYRAVDRELRRAKIELPLRRISILSPGDSHWKWVKTITRTGRLAIASIRSSNGTSDDGIVEDAYIYRSGAAPGGPRGGARWVPRGT